MTAIIKNVASTMTGVSLYGIVSVCLFVSVFLGAVWLAVRMNQAQVRHMGGLPLEDGERPAAQKGNSHE
jgi:hypothetical protein